MENCFVKKYNGTIDDDSILKYGELRIEVNVISASADNMEIISTINQKVKILTSGVTFVGGGTELSLIANHSSSFSVTGNCIISIENKYKISRFIQQTSSTSRIRISIDDLKYLLSLSVFRLNVDDTNNNNDITGNIANLPASITDFRVKRSKIIGDIGNLPNNMDTIMITSTGNITGNLNTLHSDILRILNFSGSNTLIGCLEHMCQNTINAGKTTGTTEITTNEKFKVVNTVIGNGKVYDVTYSSTGCTITNVSGGGNLVATCVKSGTAGSYTFAWTDGNGNSYVPTY